VNVALDRPKIVRLCVLLVWAGLHIYLLFSGKLAYFLHPDYTVMPAISAVIFIAMAVWMLFTSKHEDSCCSGHDDGCDEHEEESECSECVTSYEDPRSILDPLQRSVLLLLPPALLLVFGFNVISGFPQSDAGLVKLAGPGTSANKSSSSASRTTPTIVPGSGATEVTYSLLESEGDALIGAEVFSIGVVSHGNEIPSGMIGLGRLLVSCCAGDARPVALLAKVTQPDSIKNGDWVRVSGILRKEVFDGRSLFYIEASLITPVAQPAFPYIY